MASLDLDRIAAAGLSVVDEFGPDGLTLKAVANLLGVTPMALYHHVEHKAALVTLLVDAAIKEEALPIPGGTDWRQDLLDMARWTRRITFAHPGIGRLRSQYRVWTPSALTLGEHWVNLWRRSGLDNSSAAWAAAASSVAIIGLVNEQMLFRDFEPPDDRDLAWRPNLRMLYEAALDPDEIFDLVVESVIDGVHARVTRGSAPPERLTGTQSGRSPQTTRPRHSAAAPAVSRRRKA
jgi:AcrR family transcriptional regulator